VDDSVNNLGAILLFVPLTSGFPALCAVCKNMSTAMVESWSVLGVLCRTGEKNCVATGKSLSPRNPPSGGDLSSRDHLDGDRGEDLVPQTHGRLVASGRLDRRGDLDLALVDRAEASSGNRVSDVGGLDGPEQAS
jgi:hypothetical protein